MSEEAPRDPAEIVRERRERIDEELGNAVAAEEDAKGYLDAGDEEAEAMSLVRATNHRLRALCWNAGLQDPEI
jgi:hypothetical protein